MAIKKTIKRTVIPDITEFTDDDGKKWIQTSTDDLFSIKELNDILESIDKDAESDEIILARIDFQKVNKEYYETAQSLKKRIRQQSGLLKRIIEETKIQTERKNRKLKELIEYIKKLHIILSHLSAGGEELKDLKIQPGMFISPGGSYSDQDEIDSIYEEVEEVVLNPTLAASKSPVKRPGTPSKNV